MQHDFWFPRELQGELSDWTLTHLLNGDWCYILITKAPFLARHADGTPVIGSWVKIEIHDNDELAIQFKLQWGDREADWSRS